MRLPFPVHAARAASVAALLVVAASVGGCGSPKTDIAGDVTRACAPLVKFQSDALALLDGQPGERPSANRATAALGLAASADRLEPIADRLDQIGTHANVKNSNAASQVSGLVTVELALRRVATDLRDYKFALAVFASNDVETGAKQTGGSCRAPLGDGTGKQLRALPTTPQ